MEVIMKMKKLCLCCMEEHEVQLVRVEEECEFKGRKINYIAEYEYCENAEEYAAQDDMISRNDISMKDAYRREVNLLSSGEIGYIREKYGISQMDLANILGWGGKTITRYESHQVQDMAHDFVLKKIDSDPEWFLDLLVEGRSRVSENAFKKYYEMIAREYEKSQDVYLRKSIHAQYIKYEKNLACNGGVKLNLDKVVSMIKYFSNAENMLHLYKVKLMKLLWYADNLSYKRREQSISGLVYTALPMGAVPVGHKLIIDLQGVLYEECEFAEGCGYHFIKAENGDYSPLDEEEIDILNRIVSIFGKDTKEQIVNRMHNEKAYKETEPGQVLIFSYAQDLSID